MRLPKLVLGLFAVGCVGRDPPLTDEAASSGAASEDDDAESNGATTRASTDETGDDTDASSGDPPDPETSDGSSTSGEPGSCPEGAPMLTLSGKAGVQISINGVGPFDVIVDTGAPTTVIDPSVASVIGAPPFVVEVAGEELPSTASFDQLPIVQSFPDAVGILGMDLLGSYAIHFDYPRERFWLDGATEADLRACAHVEGVPATVELEAYGGYLWVQGAMEGYAGWMLLDTGATLGAVVDTAFDVLVDRADRAALQGFYTEAIIATFWAELTTLGDIAVGGLPVESVIVRTIPEFQLPLPPDASAPMLGLLPTPFLRHFLVTVDVEGGTLRLDRAVRDAGVEPPQYFPLGLGTELSTAPPIHVGQVLPGSSAEEEGVLVGDRIVAVGGQSFDQLPPTTRPWALVSFGEGDTTSVTLQRGGEVFDVVLETRDLLLPP